MQQTRSSSNPSQYSWNAALKAVQNAQKMDEVFNKVLVKLALTSYCYRCCRQADYKHAHCISQSTSWTILVVVHLQMALYSPSQHMCARLRSRPGFGCANQCFNEPSLAVCCMPQVYNAIEQHAALLKRDAAVRLKLWLTKLNEQVTWAAAAAAQHSCQHALLCFASKICKHNTYLHTAFLSS